MTATDSGSGTPPDDNTSDPREFTITVRAVNDAPGFDLSANPDQNVDENSGLQNVPSFATNISPGPDNESGQTVSFLVENDNTALFSVQPAISPNGALTYTPDANATGSATVTVRARDGGSGTPPNENTGQPRTFTITVSAAATNSAPTITSLSPPPGSEIKKSKPAISAIVEDAETELTKADIELFVDGEETASPTTPGETGSGIR